MTASGVVVVHTLPTRLRTDARAVLAELRGAYQVASQRTAAARYGYREQADGRRAAVEATLTRICYVKATFTTAQTRTQARDRAMPSRMSCSLTTSSVIPARAASS